MNAYLAERKKPAVTLIELIVAMILLAVILLGVSAFDNISNKIFISSVRRSHLLNELTYVLDHLDKHVKQGDAGAAVPALSITAGTNPSLSINSKEGAVMNYTFDAGGHKIVFKQGGAADNFLTSRFYNDANVPFGISLDDQGALVNNLTFIFDPSKNYHPDTNPKVTVKAMYFYPDN